MPKRSFASDVARLTKLAESAPDAATPDFPDAIRAWMLQVAAAWKAVSLRAEREPPPGTVRNESLALQAPEAFGLLDYLLGATEPAEGFRRDWALAAFLGTITLDLELFSPEDPRSLGQGWTAYVRSGESTQMRVYLNPKRLCWAIGVVAKRVRKRVEPAPSPKTEAGQRALLKQVVVLGPRDRQIIELSGAGLTQREIAKEVKVSLGTVNGVLNPRRQDHESAPRAREAMSDKDAAANGLGWRRNRR